MKIALLIGHRKSKQGNRSVKKISEFAYWYTFLHTVVYFFPKKHEYRVFERLDSDGRGYKERMKAVGGRAKEWGADVIISFHFNSFFSPKAEGFEVLCTKNQRSRALANDFLMCMDQAGTGDNRGVKVVRNDPNVRGSGFLYKTPMPAILVEPFFGSNFQDFKLGTTTGWFTRALIAFLEQLE